MNKLSFCLIMLLAIVPLGAAQGTPPYPEPSTYAGSPSDELILTWLHTPDLRIEAWAAHFILSESRPELLPEITQRLEAAKAPVDLQSNGARLLPTFLDAAIGLDGTLTPKTLAYLPSFYDNQRIILLSRLPWESAIPLWWELYHSKDESRTAPIRIAAQKLAQQPAKGFAGELLASIVVSAHIRVHDPGDESSIGMGTGSCCGGSAGRSDWPEPRRYYFLDPPAHGKPLPADATLLLPGPDAVYLSSTRVCAGLRPLNDAIRSHLIGVLLGGSPTAPFPERAVDLDVSFSDREAYSKQVTAFVDQQEANVTAVAQALTARNLITEVERQSASLAIHLFLRDQRKQPAPDLPEIAFRPPVVWLPLGFTTPSDQ